jgi:small subunit ribosomal protein S6
MKKYEIMYVVRDGLDEETRKAEVAKVHAVLTSNGATIINVNEWGSRDLAYEIKEQRKGYYVVVKVTASAEAVKEFDRLAKINNAMLRHLIIVDPEQK